MTLASYQVPAKECQIEQEVKRSKFLGFVAPATSRQEADDFIRTIRKQHPHANHVCWAYIAGAPNTTIRSMSDDGEPNGTAGMPMLKVLEYSGLLPLVLPARFVPNPTSDPELDSCQNNTGICVFFTKDYGNFFF